MVALALVLHALFLALAFGLRTAVHLARTGSAGFRALSQNRTFAERAGVLLLVGGGASSLIGSAIAGVIPMVDVLDRAWIGWLGAGISAAAIGVILVAQFTMGASWRIGVDPSERTDLVTHGIFSLVRNPIFTGMLAFWCGIALVTPNALTLLAPGVAFAAVELQVRGVEEPYLQRVHGEAYRAYAARTGRLLPWFGRLKTTAPPPA